MNEEKTRITHNDEQEREFQETNEIRHLSEAVMQLVQDVSIEFSAEMNAEIGNRNSTSPMDVPSGVSRFDSESALQPGAFLVSRGRSQRVTAEHAFTVECSMELTIQDREQELRQQMNQNSAIGMLHYQESEGEVNGRLQSTSNRSISQTDITFRREQVPLPMDGSALSVVATRVTPEDEEERVLRRVLSQAVQADVVVQAGPPEKDPTEISKRTLKRNWVLILGGAFLVTIALVVGLYVGLTQNNAGGTTSNDELGDEDPSSSSPQAAPAFKPTLQAVRERGMLRCGLPDVHFLIDFDENGDRVGLEVDLCRGFAAGIFGNKSKFEMVDIPLHERFTALATNITDLHIRAAPTIGRDIREVFSGVGFSFSQPYLHSGVGFVGNELFVQCADNQTTRGECSALMVCAVPGTTHLVIIKRILPSGHILQLPANEILGAYDDGKCNVIGGSVWSLVSVLMREDTYLGKQLNHESLSIMTRDDDPEWSDLVNWMLQSLFEAEKLGITQSSAEEFRTTSVFGDQYENIFRDVVGAAGNYGELYDRHLESLLPRSEMMMNFINTNHTSGIIWAPGFDGRSDSGPAPIAGGELERISSIGHLSCGITDARPGFAEFNSTTEQWRGLDVDFCRAVGGSIFFGLVNNETVRFLEFEAVEDGYEALADRSVDILCGQQVTLGADISGYGSGEGAAFSLPYFYDQEGGNRALAARQSDAQWSSFVYWVVACTIYAEANVENEITQAASNGMPEVKLFGQLYRRMFRDAILAVGNYGEIYDRNLENLIPRSGLNLLNVEDPVGPQFYPLPFDESAKY